MPFFKPKQLPGTSYGYQPPAGATARGWCCSNPECSRAEYEPVKRWPLTCPECGASADPIFDEPWAHEAKGLEWQYKLQREPDEFGIIATHWIVWQYSDAVLQQDTQRAMEVRGEARTLHERFKDKSWWQPGSLLIGIVDEELRVGDLDNAAKDLCYWLSISSAENVENDNSHRTNCRQVIDAAIRFLSAERAASHESAAEIRSGCLRLAEGAFLVLSRELQASVTRLSRS